MRRSFLIGIVSGSIVALGANSLEAAPTLRVQFSQHGDMTWIGNTLAQECAATARAPVVGTVGGITAKKGHMGLVRAARRVVDACPGTRFVFVGLPIDPEPVRAEIERLGLASSVELA